MDPRHEDHATMTTIERIETAYDYMKAIAATMEIEKPKAIAVIRIYDADPQKHPVLRDRTEETAAMLRGLVGDLDAPVAEKVMTGAEMKPLGYDTVGAAYVQKFKILVA
jgi:hypothetical protein